MQSKATNVDDYLKEVPTDRLEALIHLRGLCRQIFINHTESMLYGMPTYTINGVAHVAFNSQKNYISLYLTGTEIIARYSDRLNASTGKSCIRFSKPQKMDFDLIAEMLREVVALNTTGA
ncbi:DUF1801 domain-containing protein [Mucilaginibacter sp. UR6-1]|uniref:iron chaperone n=1 Tax=Mucilaginibacter sp. UR6-1 TaxID=1435643 RepID=UPI001E39EBB0|nr:DUF1801 domain-containing protein [Mucilaginibacter sp. UR6-1]MCC8407422.1 DUF1801 domain-containing protein [Mucilaginibacter sp. UR6-1]